MASKRRLALEADVRGRWKLAQRLSAVVSGYTERGEPVPPRVELAWAAYREAFAVSLEQLDALDA